MFAGRIYADFQALDDENRVLLTAAGTKADLARAERTLREGDAIRLYTDDADDRGEPDPLLADATVAYNQADGCWAAAVDWDRLIHSSDAYRLVQKRFFDTSVAEILRALDGRALVAATLQSLCVLDHLAFLRTGRGESSDFKDVVREFLVPLHPGYDPDWLWQVRNGLAHQHGASKAMRSGTGSLPGVWFTDSDPAHHLAVIPPAPGGDFARPRVVLNVDSFVADVVSVGWKVFESPTTRREQVLQATETMFVVAQPTAAADKPYAHMHRSLKFLDAVEWSPSQLAEAIREQLVRTPAA